MRDGTYTKRQDYAADTFYTVYDKAAMARGYLVINRFHPTEQRFVTDLIDMDGTILHSWPIDLPKILPGGSAGEFTHVATALPDGSLLVNFDDVTAMGLDPYYAIGRQKHHTPDETHLPLHVAARESVTTEADTPKESMARKLRTELGRKLYAARKHIVEPVFGQIKSVRGFRKFSQRGLKQINAEWQLICATHNLLKIWRCVFSSG